MKKIVFILVFGFSLLWSATLVVDNNASPNSCEGTTSPYTAIQDALDDSSDGDTIEICKGTYDENLNVNENNLTIKGVDGQAIDDVVVDGGSDKAIIIGGKNETFDNFKIKSDARTIDANSSGGGGYTFKNLIIDSGKEGIYLNKGDDQIFQDLNITADKGIYTDVNVTGIKDFNDINISSSEIGIEITAGGKVSFDTLDINSSDNTGILIRDATSGDHTFNNMTVNSKSHSIYIQKGGKSFTNLTLNSTNGLGLAVQDTDANLTFSNITVRSNLQGIYTDSNATGMKDFKDINISSSASGIHVDAGSKISFDTIDINSSSGKGINMGYYARGNHTFNHIKINSSADSIYARKGFASIKDANLTSSNGFGIVEYTYVDTNISNVQINSKSTGIMFYSDNDVNITVEKSSIILTDSQDGISISKAKNFTVDSVCIANAKRGVYFYSSVDNATIKNSKIENTTGYAIDSNSSSSSDSATINNNCLSGDKLAYSSNDSYNFDSNYWDGVSDVDGDGKITHADNTTKISDKVTDNSPLSSCSITCSSDGASSASPLNYLFDAWDIFRDINDRNISTKRVDYNISLTIASLDENGTNYQDFNGTVCATVDNNTSKLDFRDQNSTTVSFKISKAFKDVRVHISWKKNADEDCPFAQEDNSTDSTDNFSIRPNKFHIDINTSSFYAGVPFYIDINATNFDGENTQDYNETNGTSFVFDINDSNSTCSAGVLGGVPNPLKFTNGSVYFDANYSDVGDVNFTVQEINGSEFALVDEDDTNDSVRLIQKFSKSIMVEPYSFAIVDYKFKRSLDQNWLYMSDVKDMNTTASFKIQAQNFSGSATHKFDKLCYANDVNFTVDVNSTSSDGNVSYFKNVNGIGFYEHNKSLNYSGLSAVINKDNFSDGNSTSIIYALNVYREYDKTKNPLSLQFKDINTTYPHNSNVKNIGLVLENNTSKYYYGRVKTKDIDTNKQSVSHTLDIEVYSSIGLDGFIQKSLDWYNMKNDNITKINNFLPKKNFKINSDDKIGVSDINSTQNISNGIVGFTITNNWTRPNSAYIHLKIPKYLWYSRYNGYDVNSSSSCANHPCFKYNYLKNNNSIGIKSGDFNGTNIGSDYNATKVTKKGVKVFR